MALLLNRLSTGFAHYIFIIRASDVVLSIIDILDSFIYLGGGVQGDHSHNIQWPLVAQKLGNI